MALFVAGALCPVHAADTVVSFQAGSGNWQLGTLAVGNIDNDPQMEIVVPYRNGSGWFINAYNADGSQLPGFPYSAGAGVANVSPTLTDVDADGRAEILFTVGTNIVALNGENGTVLWQTQVSRNNYVPDGGFQVVPGTFYWSGGGQLPLLPASSAFFSEVSPPLVADIDDDGNFDVLTAWKIDPDTTSSQQDFNPFINDVFGSGEWGTMGENWSGSVAVHDARTGAKKFYYHMHQLVESGLAVGQADTDEGLEVFVLNDSDSVICFDLTKPHGYYGKGMLHKQFGKNSRLNSGTYQLGVDVYAADIDGDGRDELLVPTRERDPLWTPHETILDDDGTVLWRKWKTATSYTHSYGWHNSACMIPCNPDHDNKVDVLSFCQSTKIYFRYWNGSQLVDRPGWPKDFAPNIPTPPVVGDVDGDGQEEILIGTYHPSASPSSGALYVYNLDGSLQESVPVAGGLKHVPFLADVNSDGKLDVAFRSMNGLLTVLNFGAGNPGAVSWASHRGNAARNGQLTVPLFPPGTPLVTSKTPGYRNATLVWETPDAVPTGYVVRRATDPNGPFTEVATLLPSVLTYADSGLETGRIYYYEIAANYGTGQVRSSPVSVVPLYNSDLVQNGAFEENNDSHWDKWWTGSLPYEAMRESTQAYQGAHSMEINLSNSPNNSSIKQYNQYGIPDSCIYTTPGKLYSYGCFFKSGGLNRNTTHWLEWNSSKTGQDQNNRPGLPYPNYFTTKWGIGTGATGWTYANRVFTMPSGFPNVELRHRFETTGGNVSGSFYIDNVFFRELPAPTSSSWVSLISRGSTWKYWDSTSAPAANWFAATFNDGSWPTGTAKFGAGSGPTGKVTLLTAKRPKYYFRKQFDLSGECQELLLEATCTDNFGGVPYPLEVWINGTALVTTGIDATTGNGNDVKYYDLTPFIPLLQQGNNTIAIVVNNGWSSWDNVAFDVGLKMVLLGPAPPPPPPPPPPLPTVSVTATDASASEAGSDPGTFNFARSGSTASALTVNYIMSGTAANGADYSALSGTVIIPAGAGSANVTLTPVSDGAVEITESAIATISANAAYTVGSPSSATVSIADADSPPPPPPPPPTVTIVASDNTANEGGGTGAFSVSRTGDTSSPLTVNYTVGGTALAGTDYTALSGSVTIPSGSSSANITVSALTDALVEATETVTATLSANAAYTVGSPSGATVNIVDAPPALPTVTASAIDASASESGDPGVIRFSRTGSTAASLTVFYNIGGSATNGTDYGSLTGRVTIPAGAASANVTISPFSDTAKDPSETVTLTIAGSSGYSVGSPSSATVTITGM